jgi:hypothetical protein
MKKVFLNLNRGWQIILSILCVFVIATVTFVACNHNESDPTPVDDGIEYLVPENARVITDVVGLFYVPGTTKLLTTPSGDVAVYVGGRSSAFYLPKEIKHYQEYYTLISATREPNILKLTIGSDTDKGSPIIKVELPDEKSDEYLEIKARLEELVDTEIKTRSTTSVDYISSTSAMNTAFNYLASRSCHLLLSNPCIPFQYATDGCYARAHYMRKILDEQYGYNCWKIFAG